ncbi:MAG TPA: glycosyltransferase family 9 protein [Steroidobacteraceae bacterium]|nr:glycosyltransferase family 9 protein [Steroidobacteraceae bacterium]
MSASRPRIAVVRLDNLGDQVLGSGLLTALRAGFPGAYIAPVVPEGLGDLYARCPVIDGSMTIPGYAQYVQKPEVIASLLQKLCTGDRFDLVINPRYGEDFYFAAPICNALTVPGGKSIGFRQERSPYAGYDGNRYYSGLMDAPETLHASRYAGVMAEKLDLKLPAEPVVWFAREDLEHVHERYDLAARPYVVVGFGASFPYKLPSPDIFRHLLARLTHTWRRTVVMVGTRQEHAMAAAASDGAASGCLINAIGQLNLPQLSALLSGAELYVGPDAGPKHMAAAAGVPVLELGWVPADHPRVSRGPDTAGWCWSAWTARGASALPEAKSFVQRRGSPGYAKSYVVDIPLADIDEGLKHFLSARFAAHVSPAETLPEHGAYTSRALKLEQDGCERTLLAPPEHRLDHIRAEHPLYDRQLPRVARLVGDAAPGELVIDIGANIGDTVSLLRMGGCSNPILAVEPSDKFFWFLQANTAGEDDVELVRSTVGPEDVCISLDESHGTACSRMTSDPGRSGETQCKPLGLLTNRPTALIKTDTDGFDASVLASGLDFLRSSLPVIWAEAEIRDPSAFARWDRLIGELIGTHTHIIAYDNFGFAVVSGQTAQKWPAIRDIMEYCYRHTQVPISSGGLPRIYYLDIGLFPERFLTAYHAALKL